MGLGEQLLSEKFNKKDNDLIKHYTYVFLGDGCLMEGISYETSALAGILKLGKLIAFWDDNKISIDGETKGWFKENIPMRYKSYGWNVIENVDGHNLNDINKAIKLAKSEKNKPS